jgi:hypothetical protein
MLGNIERKLEAGYVSGVRWLGLHFFVPVAETISFYPAIRRGRQLL